MDRMGGESEITFGKSSNRRTILVVVVVVVVALVLAVIIALAVHFATDDGDEEPGRYGNVDSITCFTAVLI